ncbi:unnamed protein product [Rhizoctonia solani]|uniref:Homeobox domain-containing protein n=1 Tax=Rhizoctonia solani TaxID=456999 RepID=A0A8H3BGP5_9AGAM|nr:unnamed protein product [Rhizoctonia solani]
MAGTKRAHSRVQEGPWLPVNANEARTKRSRMVSATPGALFRSRPWIRTNHLPVSPEEGTLVTATYNGKNYWESLPPALSIAPLYPRPVQLSQLQAPAPLPTRCISAPPSAPIPSSEAARRSSLVETLVRPDPIRRVSAPMPSLSSLASAAVLVHRTTFGDSSDSPLTSASDSTTDSSSVPPSPVFAGRTVGIVDQRLARFAQRVVQNGKFGEWTTEKKDVLYAYFLTNSFPNMNQREALGRQVKLEASRSSTPQVSKFFSRTRSEIKYAQTTLEHLAEQVTFGMRLVSDDGIVIPYELGADTELNHRRGRDRGGARGRGQGRGRGHVRTYTVRSDVDKLDTTAESFDSCSPAESDHVGSSYMPDIHRGSDPTLDSGTISSSVQEAARSLMSISSAAYHSTQTQTMHSDRTSERVTSTDASGTNLNLPSSHDKTRAGLNTVAAVPRDTPNFPVLRQAVSLFGPDARKLPSPNLSALYGHSGSHNLGVGSPTSANQLVGGDGAAIKPITPDSLSLAVDIFLGVTTLAR